MTLYDIKFDVNHDMYLDGADIAFADETNILSQRLKIRLQFLFGEWFLDNQVGIPYTQFVFEQGSSLEDIYAIFRKEIIETDGVESLQKLELTPAPNNKELRIDFVVNNGIAAETIIINLRKGKGGGSSENIFFRVNGDIFRAGGEEFVVLP